MDLFGDILGNGDKRPPAPEVAEPADVEQYNLEFAKAHGVVPTVDRNGNESDAITSKAGTDADESLGRNVKHKADFPWLWDPSMGVRWDFNPIALRNLAQTNTWVGMLVQTITKEVAETPWTIVEADGRVETQKRLSTHPEKRDPIAKADGEPDELPDETARRIHDLLSRPNPDDTWQDMVEMWLGDLLEVGSTATVKAFHRSAYGPENELKADPSLVEPRALQPSAPEVWTKDYHERTGVLDGFWQFDDHRSPGTGSVDSPSARSRGVQQPTFFDTSEMIWSDMTPRTNRRYGIPPTLLVEDFLQSLDLAITQEQQYLSRGSLPSGMIVFEGWDRQEVKEWKEENQENIKGKPWKLLTIAGKEEGVRFEPFTYNFEEMQFTERMKWYARVVASAFQVPTAVVGIEPERVNYNCYTEDTEVLTENGWKHYDEVGDDEQIGVYDPDDHTLQFEVPEGRVAYDAEGEEIAHLGNTRTDFAVTQDHKLLFTNRKDPDDWRLKPYRDIDYQNIKFRTAPDEFDAGDGIDTVTLDGVHSRTRTEPREDLEVDANTFLEFVGYFISEGGFDGRENRYGVNFCQTDEIGERVQDLLDDMGLSYTTYKRDVAEDAWSDAVMVDCYDKRLYTWLEENCGIGSGGMQIPRQFLDLPHRQLKVLFRALMDGDGHYKSDKNTVYTTTSEQLADDVQELAFKLGYAASIANSPRHPDEHADAHVVNILEDGGEVEFRRYDESLTEETVDYDGRVWCFETSTGVFVTRRNGKVAIQGNTFQGERENFENNTLGPYLQKIERFVNKDLIHLHWGQDYRFEFMPGMSETTRDMISSRVRSEFNANIRTRNEARRELGLSAVDPDENGFKDDVVEDPGGEGPLGDVDGLEAALSKQDGTFEADIFRVVLPDDADSEGFDDDAVGIGVDFPNDAVYVDWRNEVFPDELEHSHVSIYGSVEDLERATGNVTEPMESLDAVNDLELAASVVKSAVGDSGNANLRKDEPLRETDDWHQFDVQPHMVEDLTEDIADDVREVFEQVLDDEQVMDIIDRLAADEETEKSLSALHRRLREIFEEAEVVGRIEQALREETADAARTAIDNAIAETDEDPDVDVDAIESQLRDREVEFADSFAEEMSEDIRATVGDGWAEGKGTREIADEIAEQVDINEGWTGAERIARQELHIATGHARSEFAAEIDKIEVWNTSGDRRVRDAHEAMDGLWKRPGDDWVVEYEDRGVQKESVPGDSEPGIGCRCGVLLRDRETVDESDYAGDGDPR